MTRALEMRYSHLKLHITACLYLYDCLVTRLLEMRYSHLWLHIAGGL